MIKKDIVEYIYEHHGGMPREEAESHTDLLLQLLKEAITENESVTITHFGRFRHKQRAVREVVMPDGERVVSAAGTRIQFLPSPHLKTRLNAQPVEEPETPDP